MTHRTTNGAVISYRPSRMPGFLSFLLTGALFMAALLATFGQALAQDRGDGGSYYDRYALPWVRAYAPPNTAPGTYRSYDSEYPRGSRDQY